MRESIGGLFLIKIMVVFIIVYNAILAIAVNYAMAFRVKNEIMNILEQNEGCRGAIGEIGQYLTNIGLSNRTGLYEIIPVEDNNRGYHYTVITYLSFNFPFVGEIVRFPIKGETKTIYGADRDSTHCSQ